MVPPTFPSRALPAQRTAVFVAWAVLRLACPAAAQPPGLSGYYLNVLTRVEGSLPGTTGTSDVQRLRVMWNGSAGPLGIDAAYEHTLTLRQAGAAPGARLFTAAGTESGGDWLPLDGELDSDERMVWRHRVDRFSVRIDLGADADLIVGRQPVSWATTLFLTPADPFSPFDPKEPFREYRAGIDAARLRVYRGAFTQFEVVLRPARFGDGAGERETFTLLGRVSGNHRGWDLGAWGGAVHGTFGTAAFLSGSAGMWALRAEVAAREDGSSVALRGAVGMDRTFTMVGRDLYLAVEVQRDGLGAASPAGLLVAGTSLAFSQGEMQVLGREVGAVQLSYTLDPLVSASGLVLGNLRDGSFIVSPGVSWSASESVTARAGAYFGVGEGVAISGTELRLGSEFGGLPRVVFGSVNWFF
ncbi:MAG: hypothetical protein OXQ94_07695 [Gemmatimonadota bacterium]|nr:hypothetical protein [Gemmatimonadota bacterium]MDE2871551.1 hypothetical protein [Gemmatimonadota bacterium]